MRPNKQLRILEDAESKIEKKQKTYFSAFFLYEMEYFI
jgi:hypothetical protein